MRDFLYDDEGCVLLGEIKSDSVEVLKNAINIAIMKRELTHYKIVDNVLKFFNDDYSAKNHDAEKLPYKLNKGNAFDFVYNCMKSIDEDKIPYEYQGDGGNGLGFIAKYFDFGEPTLRIEVLNLYYSK